MIREMEILLKIMKCMYCGILRLSTSIDLKGMVFTVSILKSADNASV